MDGIETFRTETFVEIARRLKEACNWLSDLGIDYPKTRIGRYLKIFETLARHQNDGTLEAAIQQVPLQDFINAGLEAHRILYIYDGLHNSSTSGVLERLRKAVKGHDLYVLDDENSSGRDFTFELTAAAMFGPVADSIHFDQEADVVAVLDRFPIFVECKRLKSIAKIESRIKEGLSQLETRYRVAANPWMARGVLALSIDKVVNPDFGFVRAERSEQIGETLRVATDAFVQEYSRCWNARAGARTLGVLVVLEAPAHNVQTNLIVTASQATMSPLRHEWSPEFEWLRLLAKGAMSRT